MVIVQEAVLKAALETKFTDKKETGIQAKTDTFLRALREKKDYSSRSLEILGKSYPDMSNSLRDYKTRNPNMKMSSIFDLVRKVQKQKPVPKLELNTSISPELEVSEHN